MGTVYKETFTKPLPAGAKINVRKGRRLVESNLRRFLRGEMSVRLDKADRLAAYLGPQLVPDPDAKPPEPTPANLARPTLTKRKTKRKAN